MRVIFVCIWGDAHTISKHDCACGNRNSRAYAMLRSLINWKDGAQWETPDWRGPLSWQHMGMLLIRKFNSTTAALALEPSEVCPCESWRRLIRRRQILPCWGARHREALQQHTGPAGSDGILPTRGSGPPCIFPSPHRVESQAPSQVARVRG